MLKILISYSHVDGGEAAAKLCKELDRYDISPWRDIKEIRAGEDWRKQLNMALRAVDAVLVLLTPEAIKSRHVTREWETAKALEKDVIPVLISPCEIPEELNVLQYRDLSCPNTYAGELISLLRDLDITIWQRVQDELGKLQESAEYTEFQPLLNELQVLLNARRYGPEIFRAFVYLVQQMHTDVKRGHNTLRQLLDQTIDGEYVQPIWPISAVFRGNDHIFKPILRKFREQIPSDPAVPIHVVLVVMSREEAEELAAFEPLQEFLEAHDIKDWTKRYKERPEDWQPFSSDEGAFTIEQIVTQALTATGGKAQPFAAVFHDIRTLNKNDKRPLLKELRRKGCMVVIDSISMYHTHLQHALLQSALEVSRNTSVVTISPTDSFTELVREMTLVFEFRLRDMEFHKRSEDEDEELGVCEEILDERRFRKWLRDRVMKMHRAKPRPSGDNDPRDFMWQHPQEL